MLKYDTINEEPVEVKTVYKMMLWSTITLNLTQNQQIIIIISVFNYPPKIL